MAASSKTWSVDAHCKKTGSGHSENAQATIAKQTKHFRMFVVSVIETLASFMSCVIKIHGIEITITTTNSQPQQTYTLLSMTYRWKPRAIIILGVAIIVIVVMMIVVKFVLNHIMTVLC